MPWKVYFVILRFRHVSFQTKILFRWTESITIIHVGERVCDDMRYFVVWVDGFKIPGFRSILLNASVKMMNNICVCLGKFCQRSKPRWLQYFIFSGKFCWWCYNILFFLGILLNGTPKMVCTDTRPFWILAQDSRIVFIKIKFQGAQRENKKFSVGTLRSRYIGPKTEYEPGKQHLEKFIF